MAVEDAFQSQTCLTIQYTVFSLDRIGTYFSEKFVTTRSSGISSVPTRQIMPT